MCGIIGILGNGDVAPILLDGLKRLEYRGYDSAGAATAVDDRLRIAKQVGHLSALDRSFPEGLTGSTGIGHTRWATHGKPSESNAHPHICNHQVALVHNGIIENYTALKENQLATGFQFTSATDTEVIAH